MKENILRSAVFNTVNVTKNVFLFIDINALALELDI